VKQFSVYILASRRNGTLYIGVTSDLVGRIWQHKTKSLPGFTARYGCDRLVYFEMLDSAEAAIMREKQTEGMAARLEDRVDRGDQSRLGGFVRRHRLLTARGGKYGSRLSPG
jgi:predicted GIY-YIG superfamily endonuclease